MTPFVPLDFDPPDGLDHELFRLRPLGPEHNASDYEAWSSSIDHIRRTPGFETRSWPRPMTLDENYRDLTKHAEDFAARHGFTYTVLAPNADDVIGCIYIYPSATDGIDADVSSWVRKEQGSLDPALHTIVVGWLDASWPFRHIEYATRPSKP